MLIITQLHYHRNGVHGAGYYAGRATWKPEHEVFHVMFAAFITSDPECREAAGHIAIMGDNDVATSYRYEDFCDGLRKFINSRGGQAMAFPHTIFQRV